LLKLYAFITFLRGVPVSFSTGSVREKKEGKKEGKGGKRREKGGKSVGKRGEKREIKRRNFSTGSVWI